MSSVFKQVGLAQARRHYLKIYVQNFHIILCKNQEKCSLGKKKKKGSQWMHVSNSTLKNVLLSKLIYSKSESC